MKILVADDDKNLRRVLANELSDKGFEVGEADSGLKAVDLLEKYEYDVLLLDLNMPGLNGLDVLKQMKTMEIPTETVILTANATVSTAIEAMKLGAYDFLTRPFNVVELVEVVRKAFEKKELLNENIHLKAQIKRQAEDRKIVTKNPAMFEILESVNKFASSDFPVLISGESGVGKELIARAIHDASKRREGAFVPLNCGAIPESTLESEFFGHEKGAFTIFPPPVCLTAQMSAYCAVQVLLEGLRRSGRELSRERLISSLEKVYEFDTGLTPLITYGPNRHIGAMGAYIVIVDPGKEGTKDFISSRKWVAVE